MIGYAGIGEEDKEDFKHMCNEIGGEHSDRHGVSTQKCSLGDKELHVSDGFGHARLVARDRDKSELGNPLEDAQAEAEINGVRGVSLGYGEDNRRALVVDGIGDNEHLKLVGGDR